MKKRTYLENYETQMCPLRRGGKRTLMSYIVLEQKKYYVYYTGLVLLTYFLENMKMSFYFHLCIICFIKIGRKKYNFLLHTDFTFI